MGKGGDVDMDVDANIDSSNSVEIVGLDDIGMRMELVVPEPIRTEGRNEFAITEPIRMQNEISADLDVDTTMDIKPIQLSNDIDLDIRPVVMDLCFKLEFGAPPPTCIRQPYSHHFGITLFGMEVLGFNFSGESRIIVDELPKKPQVVLGGSHGGKHVAGGRSQGKSGSEDSLRIRFD